MVPKPISPLVCVALLLLLMIWVPQAVAVDKTLAWNAPTTYTNGSAATDLAGYHLYYWQGTGTPQLVYTGSQTSALVRNLAAGATYRFAVAAYNTAGNEGVWSETLIVTIEAVNSTPSAINDTASATTGTSTIITVLANDTDADGNLLSITAVTQGLNGGIVTINSGTTVTYQPPSFSISTDTFTYTISDGKGGIATGTVTVTILAANRLPVAVNDTITTTVGVPAIITVVANDYDPDGSTLTLVPIPANTRTAHGTLSSSGNSVTYTPDATYVGTDTFTYTISDGKGGIATGTVTVDILPNRAASLVAAYHFNEGSGTTVADASGSNNTGTISGATWTPQGRYAGALLFDGSTASVTIPNKASLQLTTAMTLEAWVYPTVKLTGWRAVVEKNVDGYYLMASSQGGNRPMAGGTFLAGNQNTYGSARLAANTWTHLAATFDRATVRLYVNGVQVASQAQTTALKPTTGTLQIGANSYKGENFVGLIDEVRIYSTVLIPAEIQADMSTSIKPFSSP